MAARLDGPETCPDCGMDGLRLVQGRSGGSQYLAEGLFRPHSRSQRHVQSLRGRGGWVAPLSGIQFAGLPQGDAAVDPGVGDAGAGAAAGDGGGAGV